MPTAHKIIMPQPGFGADGPPRTPFVLEPSAAVRMARAHEGQYTAAINGYRGRFNLLDYLFSSHRMIAEALESGATSRELFGWACEQFEPRVPCSYPHFRASLAKFRRLMEIPSRQERLKRLAAQLRGAAVESRPSAKGSSVPAANAACDSQPKVRRPELITEVVLPATSIAAPTSAQPVPVGVARSISPVPERSDPEATFRAPVSTQGGPPEAAASPVPPKAGPPVPVAPRLGMVAATGSSADFLRRLSVHDPNDRSTATSEERSQARMRERELRVLAESEAEEAARLSSGVVMTEDEMRRPAKASRET